MKTVATTMILSVSITLALALGGCATLPGATGPTAGPANAATSGSTAHGQCNTAAAALVGGLLGALVGNGKGHLLGAAVGAGIGALACTAYNYHVRKLEDAEPVNAAYIKQHGALPQFNTVTAYASTVQPGTTVQAGSDVAMQSTVQVVKGTQDAPPQMAEQLTLIGPDGKTLSTSTKPAAAIDGSGEYQTNFGFTLPKGVKEGQYTVQTALLMNGRAVRTNTTPVLVVG